MRFRELGADRLTDWLDAGHRQRDFFAHRVFHLRKAAPDGYKLAVKSRLRPDRGELWEIALFAVSPAFDGLPDDLFFDDDLIWHRQQFGLKGQIAVASVLVKGSDLYTAAHHSDLVQRISRRREHKTRVEKQFKGWDRLLLNAIVGFAAERGISRVNVPTAPLARQQTDQSRQVDPELFERVYDRHVNDSFEARANGDWWTIDVVANRHRVVLGAERVESRPRGTTICVCHDIERGLGHRQVEPRFADDADATAGAHLDRMLTTEAEVGVIATYNVVGTLFPEVRDSIENSGHSLGFHTFDHHIETKGSWLRSVLAHRLGVGAEPDGTPQRMQLARCRTVDYRIKGYRPAQSRLGADTDEGQLAHQNFEWLASSSRSFGFDQPRLERGIVKLPILFDDFPLHHSTPYEEWETRALERLRDREFTALSLHDCYAAEWIEHYPAFLTKLRDIGELKTLDQVAAELTLEHAG